MDKKIQTEKRPLIGGCRDLAAARLLRFFDLFDCCRFMFCLYGRQILDDVILLFARQNFILQLFRNPEIGIGDGFDRASRHRDAHAEHADENCYISTSLHCHIPYIYEGLAALLPSVAIWRFGNTAALDSK